MVGKISIVADKMRQEILERKSINLPVIDFLMFLQTNLD